MGEYVYVVISKTPSKFARAIRKISGAEYNHAAISFDSKLEEMYSFGRYRYNLPLAAGCVKENVPRYTLKIHGDIPIRVFQIPVTAEQKNSIREKIESIMTDDEYEYNFFSVLLFPFVGGFDTYKAFTCVEFVMNMLEFTDVILGKKPSRFQPYELIDLLGEYQIYDGQLLDYVQEELTSEVSEEHERFFEHVGKTHMAHKTVQILSKLAYRNVSGAAEYVGSSAIDYSDEFYGYCIETARTVGGGAYRTTRKTIRKAGRKANSLSRRVGRKIMQTVEFYIEFFKGVWM